MPGGIDPHTHLEMPFMGTYSADDFESGTRAALSGGTTMVVDFCLPNPASRCSRRSGVATTRPARRLRLFLPHGGHLVGRAGVEGDGRGRRRRGITTFKHFMAYKGALMVNDDEMFSSFQRCAELGALPLVHAENGDVVARCRQKLLAEGNNGPEAHAYSRPPEVEGEATNRAIMIADMAGVPLYIVHTSCEQAHEAIRRARQQGKRVYGEPLIQHLVLDETSTSTRTGTMRRAA
jgi:dihydropyrimidinase